MAIGRNVKRTGQEQRQVKVRSRADTEGEGWYLRVTHSKDMQRGKQEEVEREQTKTSGEKI